jgi:5'-3' exonuclease
VIQIYDANAYLRQSLNRNGIFDPVGASPRLVYEAANASPYPQIWVWDGANNNERRRAIFPGYKIRDYTGQEDIFAGLKLYRELLTHSKAMQIEVPEWEADDVCGTLAKHYAGHGQLVTVHTNDFDFHQLTVHPLIKIKGMRPEEGIEPRYVSLYKALCGDKSDKIDGIPGFGKKTFLSMCGIWDVLDRALRERDAETFRSQPFKPKPRLWLSSDENMELIFAYHQITQMLDVPLDLIEKHTKPGQLNIAAAQSIFSRFML